MERRQARRNAAEARADGLDRQMADHTTTVPPTSATIVPGTPLRHDSRQNQDRATTPARGRRAGSIVPSAGVAMRSRSANSPAPLGHAQPRKSLICVLAMSTAMPLVKPTTTGRGMNRTAVPMPVAPSTTRMTPAIIVHMNRPSTPCAATMPATTTTNAPVGPPIWTREPPSAEMMKPVTIAQ